MKKNITVILLISFLIIIACNSEKKSTSVLYNIESSRDGFRVMFYNVENLFDTKNDPEKRDDEFTIDGVRYWSDFRFKTKLRQIYQVIVAVGGWDLPEIVGVCEVENRFVLEEIINRTPLYTTDYKIIHYESPDNRGIDVGLFYRESKFTPIMHYPVQVVFPERLSTRPTRDILYVQGATNTEDTLHIFVNHWPSKFGGEMETEPLRMYVAELLNKQTDSILKINKRANIILMGDFNDETDSQSIVKGLKAKSDFSNIRPRSLYNLSYHQQIEKGLGSLKFRGVWGLIDQFIVSGALLDKQNSIYTSKDHIHIFSEDWLLEKDDRYGGKKPYRTYIGYKYHGGFSDHLPIYLDVLPVKD
jgi:endonuclease/exonuclease/phosphatase family metal-dependent hydrolase